MRKLLLVATIGVAGLLSAKDGNVLPKSSNQTNENEKSEKIVIKENQSQVILFIAGGTKCYVKGKNGKLIEVPCPDVIITEN